ncbi:hypothetical protein IE81DRAFT_325149 [Ceraceosorus guamensis]|uniref:Sec20-domain-containing protein n=1 Tax=Ceraceosorus guamensis TaxID=1522189 RepID=A0A316VUH8_9BASI|nr:hypothetical protein IE81DRAFT_325149 [Ceraceosorus guamensis]PWN40894.1 hypothetical protein IE81DRAFT_325149 [Ceraceosorus guamensis]
MTWLVDPKEILDRLRPPSPSYKQLDRVLTRLENVEAEVNNQRGERNDTLDASRRALVASRHALDAVVSTGGQRIAMLDQRNIIIEVRNRKLAARNRILDGRNAANGAALRSVKAVGDCLLEHFWSATRHTGHVDRRGQQTEASLRIAQKQQFLFQCIVLLNWYRSSSPALIYDHAIALLVALTFLISLWQCLAWLANKFTRALAKFDLVPDASRL